VKFFLFLILNESSQRMTRKRAYLNWKKSRGPVL
jgi:hypothetical protein